MAPAVVGSLQNELSLQGRTLIIKNAHGPHGLEGLMVERGGRMLQKERERDEDQCVHLERVRNKCVAFGE